MWHWRRSAVSLAVLSVLGCGFDTDAEAPYLDPPNEVGTCGSTADLFPKLEAFVADGKYMPLKAVVQTHLQPTPANPVPDPSWRSVVNAILGLLTQIGLEEAGLVATIIADGQVEDQIGPLVSVVLEFMDGRLDGKDHYEVAESAALFVDRCDASYLLASVEGVLRLHSPSTNKPWLVAVLDAASPLLENPTLLPFLESFEQGGAEGRPAIVAVLAQIMGMLADEDFHISRVENLIESVVYPLIDAELETDLERLMVLLGEATDPNLEVFAPLQQAMRCGIRHPADRDVLLGFTYDLFITPEVGLQGVLEGVGVLRLDVVVDQLDLLADVTHVLIVDDSVQRELRSLLILFLGRPVVDEVVPVLIDLFEEEILGELLSAVVTLLEGCGRAAPM